MRAKEEVRVWAYAINGLKLIVRRDLSGAGGRGWKFESVSTRIQSDASSAAAARCQDTRVPCFDPRSGTTWS